MQKNTMNWGDDMKIALTGPQELTDYDKKDIETYLRAIVHEHEIILLAYRSIEIELFKFFINNAEFASKLTIYTFQNLDELPESLNQSIRFLISHGANYRSFNHDESLVKRDVYVAAWRSIIERVDTVVSFYNQEKITLMIPIDEAKAMNKKGIIYYLPGYNIDKFQQTADKKMRFVE